jgi:hypothetical protein
MFEDESFGMQNGSYARSLSAPSDVRLRVKFEVLKLDV